MVLEASQHARRAIRLECHLDRDVSDQPPRCPPASVIGSDRPQVDQPDTRQRFLAQLVRASKQLVAAAYGEHYRAAVRGRVQRLALVLRQVVGAEPLVAVLSATDV